MKYLILLFGLLSQLFSQFSTATEWQSDPAHSELAYSVNFEQLPINGEFKDFTVDYTAGQQLRVVVDIASVDMGNSDINEAIRDVDWFDLKHHSQAVFFSDNIRPLDQGNNQDEFIAKGTLKLKGITKPVNVPFNWQRANNPGQPNTASMTGKLSLKRSDFAIGSSEWASGDQIGIDVTVRFDVQMAQNATQ